MDKKATAVLSAVKERYEAILEQKLVGIYVHGSIAFDCFCWAASDIDYIVVVREDLTMEEKAALMETTVAINRSAPPKGLEMSVVHLRHCLCFRHPTPFLLHYSNVHAAHYAANPAAYCAEMNGLDEDLAAHFTVIRHKGMVLCGAEIQDVFAPVPKEFYLESIQADVRYAITRAGENPVYCVLNLCRVLAYMADGAVLSKREGGEWGLAHLPSAYGALIAAALADYVDEEEKSKACAAMEPEAVARFCKEAERITFE